MDKIILSEDLHCVIQGEGPNIGKKMVLVRTFGCPVKCPSCDSPHTWTDKKSEYSVEEFYKLLKKTLKKYKTNHILLTGGEPALYVSFLKQFFEKYNDKIDWTWDIESSAVLDMSDLYDWQASIMFNFSPKVGALAPERSMPLLALKELPDFYCVKVVVSKSTWEQDLENIKKIQEEFKIEDDKIYCMPKGIDKTTIIRESKWLISKLSKRSYNFSTRLHILIFNKKKMV